MPRFTIQGDVFARLANASMPHGNEKYPSVQSVRLEYRSGKYYAVASSSWIMAVEYIGETIEPDCAVNIQNTPQLIATADNVGILEFDYWPELNVLTAIIDQAAYVTALMAPDDEPKFREWWKLFPASDPIKPHGFLFLQTEMLALLGNSSPSGKLCFPPIIDNTRPVMVRDADDPAWVGLFLTGDKDKQAKPAFRPEWLP